MKKNIIIAVLVVLTVISGITSLINQIEANKLRELNQVHIEEAALQRALAEECAHQAKLAEELARQALDSAMARAKRAGN